MRQLAAGLCVLAVSTSAGAGIHPNLDRGFDPEKLYQEVRDCNAEPVDPVVVANQLAFIDLLMVPNDAGAQALMARN